MINTKGGIAVYNFIYMKIHSKFGDKTELRKKELASYICNAFNIASNIRYEIVNELEKLGFVRTVRPRTVMVNKPKQEFELTNSKTNGNRMVCYT